MFRHVGRYSGITWRWFRSLPPLIQALIAVPFLCGLLLTVLVGNMGLAFLGGAIALSSWIVGIIAGLIGVIVTKATAIVIRDYRK